MRGEGRLLARTRRIDVENANALALDRFRSEVWPRFRNLYQTRASLVGFGVDAERFGMIPVCSFR